MKELIKEKLDKLKHYKVEGITKRWLINIILVIVVLFLLAFVICSFTIKSYYYRSVENIINAGVSDSSVNYFKNNMKNGKSLETCASDFADSYSNRDKTTLWIIDNNGNVILSTSGFSVETPKMPDYNKALVENTLVEKYVGKNVNGEKIMAVTRIIKNDSDKTVGALRIMTSLEQVDRQIASLCMLIGFIFILVLAIIVASNLFFIRSIINPLREVSKATQLIANGNLDVRIEKHYNDEIGDLSDNINTMAAEISTADKMKNDFLSTISHELRTPLTSIKGWGETLTLGNQDNVDSLTRKGLQVIVKEAARLEGFVEELLDFSRLQSGRMTLRLAKTDILCELEETLFTFCERAKREGYDVLCKIPEIPTIANADANRLKQVFMNILDNALKYSRPGSKIFVKAEIVKPSEKNFIQIMVVDQGCGISAKDLPHVKEKFYKANVSVKGSGIGLAVTNEIVNLHGGTLDIDSVENKGTMVTIKLPIEEILKP